MTISVLAAILAATLLAAPSAHAQTAQAPPGSARAAAVDLNAASLADLEGLPGIGRSTAERILEYRQKHGPFKKVEELMNVKGIGEKSFLRLKPLVTVGPPRAEKAGGGR